MVRMQDIATRAGVAKGTVSAVLSGKEKKAGISSQTSARIRFIAEELGYHRNELAHSIATGQINVIAFISWSLGEMEHVGKIMSGLASEIGRQNFSLKIYHLTKDNTSIIAKQIMEQRVAGVILHGQIKEIDPIRQEIHKQQIPCATLNLSNDIDIGITSDDFQGTKEAVKYLASLGHRKILYLSVLPRVEYSLNRENGFIAGMKEYVSNDTDVRIIRETGDIGTNHALFERILKEDKKTRPTAIACSSDYMACEVMQVAYRLGVKIPEELSIVGFAGLDIARLGMVPLTTVAQPFAQMGEEAVKMLIDAIKKKRENCEIITKNVKLATRLVIRESTMPITEG